jgi:hypothetical protein
MYRIVCCKNMSVRQTSKRTASAKAGRARLEMLQLLLASLFVAHAAELELPCNQRNSSNTARPS